MTGLSLEIHDNNVILSMSSDNPESKNWSKKQWLEWLKGWIETTLKLMECGVNL